MCLILCHYKKISVIRARPKQCRCILDDCACVLFFLINTVLSQTECFDKNCSFVER